MTEGEVPGSCENGQNAAANATQHQTHCGPAPAVQNPPFQRKRGACLHDEVRLAIIGAEFRSHPGKVGLWQWPQLMRFIDHALYFLLLSL